jgi:hypothetical protein
MANAISICQTTQRRALFLLERALHTKWGMERMDLPHSLRGKPLAEGRILTEKKFIFMGSIQF